MKSHRLLHQPLQTVYFRWAVLLASVWLLCSPPAMGQASDITFKHLTTNEGLSADFITSIVQDRQGLMWFGTESGLNKYDGYQFTVYRHDSKDTTSLSENKVWCLLEDSRRQLWVGTLGGGVDLFDREKSVFRHYRHEPANKNSLSDNRVQTIYEDRKGNVWIGTQGGLSLWDRPRNRFINYAYPVKTQCVKAIYEDSHGNLWVGFWGGGVSIFDRQKTTFRIYNHQADKRTSISNDTISGILEDRQGELWIITHQGVNRFDRQTDSFVHYLHDANNAQTIANLKVHCQIEDVDGNLWFGHLNGVSILDKTRTRFTHHTYSLDNPRGLNNNFMVCINQDRAGNVWMGSRNTGLNIYYRHANNFQLYTHQVNKGNSLNNNIVKAIVKDRKGRVWLGTDGGGINLLQEDGSFKAYQHRQQDARSLPNNLILALYEDKKENLWVSTFNGALSLMNRETGTFEHFFPRSSDSSALSSASVSVMYEDRKGNFWVGTWYGGLHLMDRASKQFTRYQHHPDDPHSIQANEILAIEEDAQGNLWIGTAEGLDRFDSSTQKFIHYPNHQQGNGPLSYNNCNAICSDKAGNLWIGTNDGLNLLDAKKHTFSRYTVKDGLPDDLIQSILSDEEGDLWLSTNRGIARFDPRNRTFRNYTLADGLQGNEFIRHAAWKSADGELFFGGNNGANSFFPARIQENLLLPPIILTDFKVFNKSIGIGGQPPLLQKAIQYTHAITLTHKQSVFSFDFAALNYTLPEKNQYAYKLEGFDKDWVQVGTRRTATYTNLDPGEYLFWVKASNNDGVWNEQGTSVTITILPPFWQTWWFRGLLAFAVVGSALTFYRIRINAIKAQKIVLEKQVQERTADLQLANQEVMMQKEELESQSDHLQLINNELKERQEEIEQQRNNLEQVNTQVMNSIKYAYTIQQAILPSDKILQDAFAEHFVLYRPKDVVSGDFYWACHLPKEEMEGQESDIHFLAVIDCTGHGVPGAFMSIIGNTLLNEIINLKHVLDPAQILEQLNKGVQKAVQKSEGINTAGMDLALVRIQRGEGRQVHVHFGGAKRPLVYLRQGAKELEILEGDRRSIASTITQEMPFTTKEIVLEEGTCLYLYSDGYADQSNPERVKLGSSRLKELILQGSSRPMQEQKLAFEQALDAHQQQAQQRDDITLIGVKL